MDYWSEAAAMDNFNQEYLNPCISWSTCNIFFPCTEIVTVCKIRETNVGRKGLHLLPKHYYNVGIDYYSQERKR
jgi:hypothetical protein